MDGYQLLSTPPPPQVPATTDDVPMMDELEVYLGKRRRRLEPLCDRSKKNEDLMEELSVVLAYLGLLKDSSMFRGEQMKYVVDIFAKMEQRNPLVPLPKNMSLTAARFEAELKPNVICEDVFGAMALERENYTLGPVHDESYMGEVNIWPQEEYDFVKRWTDPGGSGRRKGAKHERSKKRPYFRQSKNVSPMDLSLTGSGSYQPNLASIPEEVGNLASGNVAGQPVYNVPPMTAHATQNPGTSFATEVSTENYQPDIASYIRSPILYNLLTRPRSIKVPSPASPRADLFQGIQNLPQQNWNFNNAAHPLYFQTQMNYNPQFQNFHM